MQKKMLISVGVMVLLAAVAGYVMYIQPMLQDRTVEAVVAMPVQNEELSFTFTYQSGEAAYTLIEPPVASSSDVLAAYLLFQTDDYIAFENNDTATEAPPAISIFVAEAPSSDVVTGGRIARLQQWAADNPQYSSFNLKTSEVEVIELDGAQAIRYTATGLYEQEVYIAFYSGNVYSFVGQSHGEGGDQQAAFTALVNSVMFN